MKSSPLISVIVTSKNEERVIKLLINSLINQTYQNIEVYLIDNNSSDRTVEIAEHARLKIYNHGPERSAQRNFGANKAIGSFLLFLDADMEVSKEVIKDCVKVILENKSVGGVIIPEESIGGNFWEKVKIFERSFYNKEGDKYTDAARFFSKGAFTKAGGYDESLTGPEDWDLSENVRKLGYKIGRIETPIYHHERINSLIDLAKKKFYYGLKAHRYLRKQNILAISPKTIYFLRPVFYKQWKRLLLNPDLAGGMILMFLVELVSGGLGYLIGRIKNI